MSWMSEISIIIETAAEFGVRLDVGDFRRSGDTLLLDGMPASEWLDAMTMDDDPEGFASVYVPDTIKELEI